MERLFSGSDLQSRRAAAAATVVIPLDGSSTNETLAAYLCGNVSSITNSVTVIAAESNPLLLPDCFYGISKSVTIIKFGTLIIQGNSSFPDPLARLALAISSTPATFALSNCYILTDTGSNATINWDAISTITLSVSELTLTNTYLGIGATIPTFPVPIPLIRLSNTGVSGSLPTPLFASSTNLLSDFGFYAASNQLTGPIPSTFLSNLDVSRVAFFNLFLSSNALSGSIPTSWLGPLPYCASMTIAVADNSFEGPLENFFTETSFTSWRLTSFQFYGDGNHFTGRTPTWLSSMTTLSSFIFTCQSCKLQTLSASFPARSLATCAYTLYLSNNQLSGGIPSTFFEFGSSTNFFNIDLSGNSLTSMPSNMLANATFISAQRVVINLANNSFTGNFPNSPGLLAGALTYYEFTASGNPSLAGTIPSSFLSAFASMAANTASALKLDVSNTGLSGRLQLPNFSTKPKITLEIDATSSDFNELVIPNGVTSGLVSLKVSGPALTGSLSASFFQNNPNLTILEVAQSKLSGTMPDMGALSPSKLTTLVLTYSTIDFCAGTRTNWTSSVLTTCTLPSGSAECQDAYPASCSFTTPPALPLVCLESTRPASDWICINGVWSYPGSVNSTVIIIPTGSTTTTIKGNVTSSTIIINGLNSIIIVDGCTSNTTIIVELTPQQLEEIGRDGKLQQLLSFSNTSMCNSSTSDLNIGTHVKGSSCKTVSVSKVPSSNGSLIGLFKIDSSGCNKWWIILVSVLCAIVLVGLVVAVIAYVIYKKRLESRSHKSLNQG